MAYQKTNPNGQALMTNSSPVVIASDQSAVPVSVTFPATQTVTGTFFPTTQTVTGNFVAGTQTVTGAVSANVTFPMTQTVTGNVGVTFPPTQTITGAVAADVAFPTNQTITGSVQVTFPSVQTVTSADFDIRDLAAATDNITAFGTLSAIEQIEMTASRPIATMLIDANGEPFPLPVDGNGFLNVNVQEQTDPVSIDGNVTVTGTIDANVTFPTTQTITGNLSTSVGEVTVSNFPAVQTITGSLSTSVGEVTISNFPTTQTVTSAIDEAVYVDDGDWVNNTSKHLLVGGLYQSNPQTTTDFDVAPFLIDSNGRLQVGGSVSASVAFPATQTVTGPLTNTELRASPISAVVFGYDGSGNPAISTDNTGKININSVEDTVTITGSLSTTVGEVTVSNFPGTQTITGTVNANVTFPTNQTVTGNVAVTFPTTQTVTANFGTEYTEGDVDSTITGKPVLFEGLGNTITSVNASTPLPVTAQFPTIQTVTGAVTAAVTFPTTQTVTGNVGVTFPTTQTITGAVTANVTFPTTQTVTGTFFPTTQTVTDSFATGAGTISSAVKRTTSALDLAWLPLRYTTTTTQSNAAIVTAASGQAIAIKNLSFTVHGSCTAIPNIIIGFGASSTPTTTSVLMSHPGVKAGSGKSEFYGDSGIVGANNDDLRITNSVPTSGSIDVNVVYKLITL